MGDVNQPLERTVLSHENDLRHRHHARWTTIDNTRLAPATIYCLSSSSRLQTQRAHVRRHGNPDTKCRIPSLYKYQDSIKPRISILRLSATFDSKSSPGSLASQSIVSRFAPRLSSNAHTPFCPCRAASCRGVRYHVQEKQRKNGKQSKASVTKNTSYQWQHESVCSVLRASTIEPETTVTANNTWNIRERKSTGLRCRVY